MSGRGGKDPLASPVAFRNALARWFDRHGRDYPWRRTRDPHAVLVSEVMLQQTQIATVLGRGHYERFLTAFPDVAALAAAADGPLLKAWEGLGYYRRARQLRATARAVLEHHGGEFPRETPDLLKLPGVGPYTAGALRAFAFELPAVLVDGNVARVLARLMDFRDAVDAVAGQRQLWDWAARLADPRRPRVYHSALMELGQTLCRPGVPDCARCPVAQFCRAADPSGLPVKGRSQTLTAVTEHALWCRDRQGRLLLHHEDGKRRTGLWKLPTRSSEQTADFPVIDRHRYTITRYRVDLLIHECPAIAPGPGESWVQGTALPALPMPSPFRKVIEKLWAPSPNPV